MYEECKMKIVCLQEYSLFLTEYLFSSISISFTLSLSPLSFICKHSQLQSLIKILVFFLHFSTSLFSNNMNSVRILYPMQNILSC